MGEIAPTAGAASSIAADGAGNGYTALQAKMTKLQKAAAALQAQAERIQSRMKANARAANTVSEQCAQAEVAPVHVGAIADVAAAFGRTASSSASVVDAADRLDTAASGVKSAHRAQYGGIYAANAVSGVRMAKPGFYQH